MNRITSQKEKIGTSLAEFATANGANFFATFKSGIHGLTRYDTERELRPLIGWFLREYGHVRGCFPRRYEVQAHDLPWLVGVFEQRDSSGNLDPHFHCMIALKPGEERLLRGFARKRWGVDMTKGAEHLHAGLPQPGNDPFMRECLTLDTVPHRADPRSWLIRDARYSPSFDLQPITAAPDRVGRYMTKQASDLICTHLEFFDNAKHPSKLKTENSSKVRA